LEAHSYPEISGDPYYLTLQQQDATVKQRYTQGIGEFIALISRFFAQPSVLYSPFLDRELKNGNDYRQFPGSVHYLFVPFGILVIFLYVEEHVRQAITKTGEILRVNTEDDVFSRMVERLATRTTAARLAPEYRCAR
jgi:hypothetical protein